MFYPVFLLLPFFVSIFAEPSCESPPKTLKNSIMKCCLDQDSATGNILKKFVISHRCESGPKGKACHVGCAFNSTGILENENTINQGNVKSNLEKLLKDEELKSIYGKAFETCATEVASNLPPNHQSSCSPFSIMVMGCVMREGLTMCPDNKLNANMKQQCETDRVFFKQCPKIIYKHPKHGSHEE